MYDKFMISLDIMWKGMFGIFAVIIIIALLVILMQKVDIMIQKFINKINDKKDKNLKHNI